MRLRKSVQFSLAILAVIILVWSVGCSDSTDPEPENNFDSVLNSTGGFLEVQEVHEIFEADPAFESINGEEYYCTATSYNINHMPADFPLFNPNAGIIYPGNLLQGNSLDQANPEGIAVARGPGQVTMTILNGSPSVSRQVDEVNLGTIMQAQNEIIATAVDTIPARFTFAMEQVHSREHMAMHLGLEMSAWGASFGSSLDMSFTNEKNYMLVSLNQSFYDMVFSPPNSTAEFFGPDVTAEDLARFVGPGNPPCYISQVTYGRIFHLVIESTSSITEMRTSIEASFDSAIYEVGLEADATYIGELEEVTIKAFALGGDASMSIMAITNDFSELSSFLANGGGIRTGAPFLMSFVT